jgi:chitodextrinase
MWTWLASFLAGPVVNGLIGAYKAKLEAANTEGAQAAELAAKAIAAEIEARKSAQAIIIAEQGRWWTALPRAIVQWSFAVFVAKCVVWDTVLAWGTTEPLGGDIATWAGWVMALWFGGRSLEKIATTIWGRR